MKTKNILIALLLPLLIGVTGCSVEKKSKDNSSTNSSSSFNNSSSSIISSDNNSSNDDNTSTTLPASAQEFVNAVNDIVMNEDAGYYINLAYEIFEELEDWDYPEVLEAHSRLIAIEEIYNDFTKQNNAVTAFIERVDSIPYYMELTDERKIVLAEDAYDKLSDEQKSMLGVSQAYQRLLEARNDFDVMYSQMIEDAKNEEAKTFTDLVELIPDVNLVTLADEQAIMNAKLRYEGLGEEIKEMSNVIEAYNKLIAAEERYNELVNNPSLNDEIVSQAFIDAANKLPSVNDLTMGNRNEVFAVYDLYKALPKSAKEGANIIELHQKIQELITKYYDLYLESVGEERNDDIAEGTIIINTVDELLAIENNLAGSYRLGADIDLSGIEWEALGEKGTAKFSGTLDGAGHTIYNMSNSNCPDARFGLFAHIGSSGVVKNLAIEGTATETGAWAGSICVDNDGTISNCLINMNLSSNKNGHIGGISCNNNGGARVENCIVLSTINGGEWDGGLFVGQYGSVINSYTITANVSNGQVVGNNSNQNNECAKTEIELKQSSLYSSFDKSIWCIVDGNLPMLVH